MIIPYNNPSASSVLSSLGSSIGMRNRIVNGDMRIDQMNGGAVSAAGATVISVDKFFGFMTGGGAFSMQRLSATPPSGFTNYIRSIVTVADAAPGAENTINHKVEGTYCQDLQFGIAANTQTITISFWVRCSLTGAFSGSVRNSAPDRSYPFSFTILAANTWEQKSVTIPSDTTGTWLIDANIGLRIDFDLGTIAGQRTTAGAWAAGNFRGATGSTNWISTAAATFDLTGVQLEPGASATTFEQRPIGDTIRLCQRELQKSFLLATAPAQNVGVNTAETLMSSTVGTASTLGLIAVELPVIMRATPTVTTYNPAAANAQVRDETGAVDCSAVASVNPTERRIAVSYTTNAATVQGNKLGVHWIADARL